MSSRWGPTFQSNTNHVHQRRAAQAQHFPLRRTAICSFTRCKEKNPRVSSTVKAGPRHSGSRRAHAHPYTFKSPVASTTQCVHLFAILLLFRGFLIVLFVGIKSGRVNTVQALSPLPVESTEFPFAAERDCCLVTNQTHAVLELMLLYFYKSIL